MYLKLYTWLYIVFLTITVFIPQDLFSQESQSEDMTMLITQFEKDNNVTATYFEAINFFEELSAKNPAIQVNEFGMTDSGFPLHEVIITNDGVFDPMEIRKNGKAILFVNNAIHPGEPCGVDASMMLARDLLRESSMKKLLEKTVVVLIPIYNISGSLNRGSYSRANQEGPEAYGFRGNAQNLDLNRDFIKGDTENAQSFNKLFVKWNPDVLIDNHTSNGADYQYVITLIPTQKDKMEPVLSSYLESNLLPDLYSKMKSGRYEMTPYVYARNTPDDGIAGFLDYARYSSGYANLHNCISFMPETPELNELEVDYLSEIFNIGVGNAASSLSLMVNQPIKLSVPEFSFLNTEDLVLLFGQDNLLCSVSQKMEGLFTAQSLLLFPENDSLEIVKKMLGDHLSDESIAELQNEAMSEIGNIVLNACIGSLSESLGTSFKIDLPEFERATPDNIIQSKNLSSDDLILFIRIELTLSESKISGYLAFLLGFESFSVLHERLKENLAKLV